MIKMVKREVPVFDTDNFKVGDTVTFISGVTCADFKDEEAKILDITEDYISIKTCYGVVDLSPVDVFDPYSSYSFFKK